MARNDVDDVSDKERVDFEVDVSPEMQIYRILQHLNYGLETAYAEFIDNSIQSFLDVENKLKKLSGGAEPKLNISIEIDTKKDRIVIKDDAGGIDRSVFQRAIKLGTEIGVTHSKESLSVYGIGMKTAAIWFSEKWNVHTTALGSDESLRLDFNLEKLLSNSITAAEVKADEAEPSQHFTVITLEKPIRHENRDHYQDTVIPFILETFAKFRDRVSINFYIDSELIEANRRKVSFAEPEELVYPPVGAPSTSGEKGKVLDHRLVRWRIPLDFKHKNRRVKGFFLLRKVGSYTQPGIKLLRNNRVIEGTTVTPNIPKSVLGTSNKFAAQRLYGELHLDAFPVDFMKTNFNENLKGLYKKLREVLTVEKNVDFIAQTNNFRKKDFDQALVDELLKKNAFKEIVDTNDDKSKPVESPAAPENEAKPDNNDGSNGVKEPGGTYTGGENDQGSGSGSAGTTTPGGESGNDGDRTKYTPAPENKIDESNELLFWLSKLEGNKLERLYKSLCTISLRLHGVLIYVGAWSFMEGLTAAVGRNDGTPFPSFCNSKVNDFTQDLKDKRLKKDLQQIISDIAIKGNCNKHSPVYGDISAVELKNHFKLLEPFLIYLIKSYEEKMAEKQTT